MALDSFCSLPLWFKSFSIRGMKLSILICHLPERRLTMSKLIAQLTDQYRDYEKFEILSNPDKSISVGEKRNLLLENAHGDYVAFIDDDDRISDDYICKLMDGIDLGVDCCSLTGIITENGANPLVFQHSIKYSAYKTNSEDMPVRYERYPNHLNCIKSSIAKQFRFPEKNHGEDTDWATQIHKSGLLKTEHWIDGVIYYYDWKTK